MNIDKTQLITFRNDRITYQRVWLSFLPIFVGSIKQPKENEYKSGQWL